MTLLLKENSVINFRSFYLSYKIFISSSPYYTCLHNYLKDIKPIKNMETVSDIISKYIWNYERLTWQ